MKNITSLVISLFLLFVACENLEKEFPNAEISEVMNDINWYNGYSKVRDLLEKKYELKYDREVDQKEEGKNMYIFSGGRINNIKTKSWSTVFEHDSLSMIVVTIESDSEKQISAYLQKLKDEINNLSIESHSEEDKFWIVKNNKEGVYGIQLASNSKAILISFVSKKSIDKYSAK